MAHHRLNTSYARLSDRLNRFSQGSLTVELLFGILKIFFSEKGAELASAFPRKPFTAKKSSGIWKIDLANARKVLYELAGRAILVDIERNGNTVYELRPPMARGAGAGMPNHCHAKCQELFDFTNSNGVEILRWGN